ncbi:MAG: NAD(P)/FAD-dependent oxidoreductase [Acidobacteriota bacterium]|nr:NAD(P)/FAD-dependent oxidoreductase [Acidobacteriota bacterium]
MFDVLIVGGSYAGLSAAMQLARARRRICVVDSGSPRNRFATASHGFFGQDGASPRQMIEDAREKLLAYPSVTFLRDSVHAAERDGDLFQVVLASGAHLQARKLILAFGLKDEMLPIPGLSERWGHSVLHCPYCHGYEFADQRLGVLAMSPISIHQAMLIPEWGPTTFFLNGQPQSDESAVAQLLLRGVTVEPAAIASLEGEGQSLSEVRLADGRVIPLNALYLAPRTEFQSSLADQLGCVTDDGPFGKVIRTDEAKLTTVPAVYAAGDIARVPHNATWASADGVTAGMAVHRSLVFESK